MIKIPPEKMKNSIVKFLSTGAYFGYSPVMPGTAGTLWGVVLALFIFRLPLPWQILAVAAIIALAVYLSAEAVKAFGEKDPKSVVIDEVAGYLIAFFFIPLTYLNLTLVFLLFRFFDILKPYPIRLIDRRMEGGTGVVLDDLLAGVFANIAAHFALWLKG